MQLLHQVSAYSGISRLSHEDRVLVEAGFNLELFKCEAEKRLAVRELPRVTETKLVKHFGVSPAWIIGDSGPFIGENGVEKLTQAFELGRQLGINTADWIVHFTSVEVIEMLPKLYN